MNKFINLKIFKNILILSIIFILILVFSGCVSHASNNKNLKENISKSVTDNNTITNPESDNNQNFSNSDNANNKSNTDDSNSANSVKKNNADDNNSNNNNSSDNVNQENNGTSLSKNILEIFKNTINIMPPKILIEVIEGPVVLEDNSVCYYRIKAKVSGKPAPQIYFSKDDSNGAWGKDISQVNLLPRENYQLTIKATNSSGQANASIDLSWEGYNINKSSTIITVDEVNPDNYLIEVSLNEQKVRVFYKKELIKEMVCSSGDALSQTPKGTFKTSDKIKYSWLPEYNAGAYYFVRFFGSYLFHSTPVDKDGNTIESEQINLGKPVSHGCVRLDINDAKWLYEFVPSGTTVKIY